MSRSTDQIDPGLEELAKNKPATTHNEHCPMCKTKLTYFEKTGMFKCLAHPCRFAYRKRDFASASRP